MWNHHNGLGCCLSIVQYLSEHREESCTTEAIDRAAGSGHFKFVQWLFQNWTEGRTSKALLRAARCGRLEMVCVLVMNRKTIFTEKMLSETIGSVQCGAGWTLASGAFYGNLDAIY